jgi:hypothetical protein
MIPIVHQLHVQKASVASTQTIKSLLSDISECTSHLRLIIDGLDECDVDIQAEVIKLVLDLRRVSKVSFKVLISSRELPHIDRQLRPKTTVSPDQKTDQALRIYIRDGVRRLRGNFRYLSDSLVGRLEAHLLKKAGGKNSSVFRHIHPSNCYGRHVLVGQISAGEPRQRNFTAGSRRCFGEVSSKPR